MEGDFMAFKTKKHNDDENDLEKDFFDEQVIDEYISRTEKKKIIGFVLPDVEEKKDEIEQQDNEGNEFVESQLENMCRTQNENGTEMEALTLESVTKIINEMGNDLGAKIDGLDNKINLMSENSEEDNAENSANIQELVKDLIDKVEIVAKNQDRNDKQITQTLRENANFQIQVRQGMQKELEDYKKVDRKEVFVPVLRDLAMTYVGYKSSVLQKFDEILNGEQDEIINKVAKLQQLVDTIFDELQEVLEDNGAEIVNSKIGDARKARQCKIMRKIPTGDKDLHNTVARSTRDGVILGRQVLCNEYVDVYVYDETLEKSENEFITVDKMNSECGDEKLRNDENDLLNKEQESVE